HRVWGEPHEGLGERLKEELANPGELAVFAAYDEGRMASAAWMYLHEGTSFCSLWGGSTLPEFQGRGHYSALLAARAQLAWKSGYRMLMVDASPMSRPILERKGFAFLGTSYPCMSPSPKETPECPA
ncbi:MAG TPA: GNAT family N-acetyltransferase, partial [Paenibacillus sp.]|nr:GNAT family N-acetyltransferase [Paenibacillus sp.]